MQQEETCDTRWSNLTQYNGLSIFVGCLETGSEKESKNRKKKKWKKGKEDSGGDPCNLGVGVYLLEN